LLGNVAAAGAGELDNAPSIKALRTGENAVVATYVHPDYSVACLVELVADRSLSTDERAEIAQAARDICMQVAVNKPLAIRPNELEHRLVENEKEIARTQLAQTTKPENMWDKIIEGKLRKFYEEVCLLNQKFIKDDTINIEQKIEALAKRLLIGKLTLTRFERVAINR